MDKKGDEILKAQADLAVAMNELKSAIRDWGVGVDRGNEFEADDFDELENETKYGTILPASSRTL